MNYVLNWYFRMLDNAGYWGVLVLTFLATFFVIFAVFLLFTRKSREEQRLQKLLPTSRAGAKAAKPKLLDNENSSFVMRFAKPIDEIVAGKPGVMHKSIRLRLIQAGWRSNIAYYNFIAAKVFLGILLPLGWLFSRFFFTFFAAISAAVPAPRGHRVRSARHHPRLRHPRKAESHFAGIARCPRPDGGLRRGGPGAGYDFSPGRRGGAPLMQ